MEYTGANTDTTLPKYIQACALQYIRQVKGIFVEKGDDCPICYDNFDNSQITSCGHVFCKECIDACIQHQGRCPICKTENILFSPIELTDLDEIKEAFTIITKFEKSFNVFNLGEYTIEELESLYHLIKTHKDDRNNRGQTSFYVYCANGNTTVVRFFMKKFGDSGIIDETIMTMVGPRSPKQALSWGFDHNCGDSITGRTRLIIWLNTLGLYDFDEKWCKKIRTINYPQKLRFLSEVVEEVLFS
jgi:hypothetical protein